MKRSWIIIGAAVVAAALVFGSGWLVATRFQSPAQRQADSSPPDAGPIFVEVERGALTDQVSGPGLVKAERSSSVTPATLPEGAVVTKRPISRGELISEGAQLTEINGRPLIVLAGKFSFYRDMGSGSQGPDVKQLQMALMRLGLLAGVGSGKFDAQTKTALDGLYRRYGYDTPRAALQNELVAVTTLPATVETILPVGAHPAAEPVAELASGAKVLKVTIASASVVRLAKGMKAEVSIDGLNRPIPAVVKRVREGTDGDAASEVTLSSSTDLSDELLGREAVATITIESVSGTELLVPVRALGKQSGKRAHVLVGSGRDSLRRVRVQVLGEMGGKAAIKPIGSPLAVGDKVKVG